MTTFVAALLHLDLRAHHLDLRGLLFKLCREDSHISLQFADGGFLLCSIGFQLPNCCLLLLNSVDAL